MLGHLYAKEGKTAEALKLLHSASELSPQDASVWLELGQLQQKMAGQVAAALKAYEKAAGVLQHRGQTVPAELWNNLGVIRAKLGKLETAETAYSYAIRVCKLGGAKDDFDAPCISTQYNLGRLYEERGELERATEQYKKILRAYPNYPEAFLRLAACEEVAGRPHEAIGWTQKALMLHARSADAFCTLGNLYLSVGELKKAEAQFKSVKELRAEAQSKSSKEAESTSHDSYATIQLAWISLESARSSSTASDPLTATCLKPPTSDKVDKAVEILKEVLQSEPNNLYAANGIGVACVAKGRLHEARQIFTQVREAGGSCDHATTNLAQLNAAMGEHATAASFYETSAKKARGPRQMHLRLLQARSHFDHRKWEECKKVLQQAACTVPESQVTWHNLGLAYLSAARYRGLAQPSPYPHPNCMPTRHPNPNPNPRPNPTPGPTPNPTPNATPSPSPNPNPNPDPDPDPNPRHPDAGAYA